MSKPPKHSKAHLYSASRLLALAVSRLFPEVEFLGGGVAEGGFYYEFGLDSSLTKETFPLIEEHLRQLASEKIPFKTYTMLADIAKAFLRDKGFGPLRESDEQVVEIVQIGHFYDECPLPVVANSGELSHLQLTELEGLGGGIFRIYGLIGIDKDDLKEKIRNRKTFKTIDHRRFLLEGQVLREPQSLVLFKLEQLLIDTLKGFGSEFISAAGNPDLTGFVKEKEFERASFLVEREGEVEGNGLKNLLLYRGDKTLIQASSDSLEETVISSLQLIEKWNKILSIEGFWTLRISGRDSKKPSPLWDEAIRSLEKCEIQEYEPLDKSEMLPHVGPRLEYYWLDKAGEAYLGSTLGIDLSRSQKTALEKGSRRGNMWWLEMTIVNSLERLTAISLENS